MPQLIRSRRDAEFFSIVQDLHWRLDDGSGGSPPPAKPEFDKGPGGSAWPAWATHLIAFLLGGITWGTLVVSPAVTPIFAGIGLVGFVVMAVKRRWR